MMMMILMLNVALHRHPAVPRYIVNHQLRTAPLPARQKLVVSRVKDHLLVPTTHLQTCTSAHDVIEIAGVEGRRCSPMLKMCSHDIPPGAAPPRRVTTPGYQ